MRPRAPSTNSARATDGPAVYDDFSSRAIVGQTGRQRGNEIFGIHGRRVSGGIRRDENGGDARSIPKLIRVTKRRPRLETGPRSRFIYVYTVLNTARYRNASPFCNSSRNSCSCSWLPNTRACRGRCRRKRFVPCRTGKRCTVDSPAPETESRYVRERRRRYYCRSRNRIAFESRYDIIVYHVAHTSAES